MARIYLDEEVSARLRDILRRMGHDVTDAKELGHRRGTVWTDARQLLHAARERRVLISSNRHDFEVLHDAWRLWPASGRDPHEHAGIVVYDQRTAQREAGLVRLAEDLSVIAGSGDQITNELWVGRGGRWYWYRWREEGFQALLMR